MTSGAITRSLLDALSVECLLEVQNFGPTIFFWNTICSSETQSQTQTERTFCQFYHFHESKSERFVLTSSFLMIIKSNLFFDQKMIGFLNLRTNFVLKKRKEKNYHIQSRVNSFYSPIFSPYFKLHTMEFTGTSY